MPVSATPTSSAPTATLGGRYASAGELADTIAAQWTESAANRYVVLTGGEPLLQVDKPFVDALHCARLRNRQSRPTVRSRLPMAWTGLRQAPKRARDWFLAKKATS